MTTRRNHNDKLQARVKQGGISVEKTFPAMRERKKMEQLSVGQIWREILHWQGFPR